MATTQNFEVLSTAYDALTRARLASDRTPSADAFRAQVQAERRLFDACIDCGMSLYEPVITEWAATRVTCWLMAA